MTITAITIITAVVSMLLTLALKKHYYNKGYYEGVNDGQELFRCYLLEAIAEIRMNKQ